MGTRSASSAIDLWNDYYNTHCAIVILETNWNLESVSCFHVSFWGNMRSPVLPLHTRIASSRENFHHSSLPGFPFRRESHTTILTVTTGILFRYSLVTRYALENRDGIERHQPTVFKIRHKSPHKTSAMILHVTIKWHGRRSTMPSRSYCKRSDCCSWWHKGTDSLPIATRTRDRRKPLGFFVFRKKPGF